jgi:hypothetical protein
MTTTAIPPTGPPAGWYPSQNDSNIEIYWDGSAWTALARWAAPSAPLIGPPDIGSTGSPPPGLALAAGARLLEQGRPIPGTHAGTGEYAGLFHDGKKWLNRDGSRASGSRGNSRSTGRTIGGVVSLIVAAIAGLQAFSWFQSFYQLSAAGNPFSGMLVPLALGAGAVAAGFGIWGVMLLAKN